MFELSDIEIDELVSQNVIPAKSFFGGASPMAFTEQGVAMLSSALRCERAVKKNIAIMRAFAVLRKMIANYDNLEKRLEKLEGEQGKLTAAVMSIIRELEKPALPDNKRIGFSNDEES